MIEALAWVLGSIVVVMVGLLILGIATDPQTWISSRNKNNWPKP